MDEFDLIALIHQLLEEQRPGDLASSRIDPPGYGASFIIDDPDGRFAVMVVRVDD